MIRMRTIVDSSPARGLMHGIKLGVRDLDRVRRDFAEYMVGSTKRNFLAGGRPRRWKPSQRALREGGQTLIKTGRLKNSITGRVRGATVLVGTNVRYGAAHQLGVNRTVIQRVRAHPRRTPDGVTIVRAHTRRMHLHLPKRPFLVLLREDRRYLTRSLLRHFARAKNLRGRMGR